MLSFLFYAFLFYVLFKLVFDFLIPIYRTTRRVKQSFRNMQQHMQDEQQASASYQSASARQPTSKQEEPSSDYIDFEEIKD